MSYYTKISNNRTIDISDNIKLKYDFYATKDGKLNKYTIEKVVANSVPSTNAKMAQIFKSNLATIIFSALFIVSIPFIYAYILNMAKNGNLELKKEIEQKLEKQIGSDWSNKKIHLVDAIIGINPEKINDEELIILENDLGIGFVKEFVDKIADDNKDVITESIKKIKEGMFRESPTIQWQDYKKLLMSPLPPK